jgi:hypothetical protein
MFTRAQQTDVQSGKRRAARSFACPIIDLDLDDSLEESLLEPEQQFDSQKRRRLRSVSLDLLVDDISRLVEQYSGNNFTDEEVQEHFE